MELLTEKQQRVLGFIEKRLEGSSPPSQREIARHFGLAQNAVYQLVGYLKKKGYLVDSGGHRGLRLSKGYCDRKAETEGVPVVGRVAAGEPILAEENIEGYVNLNGLFGKVRDVFLLKVVGDSMVDEGIMDGDYVVVEPASTMENGRIGVVLMGDEATVKRIYIQRNRIALKPANRAAGYKTKYLKRSGDSVRIIGKVIGCLRTIN
ncbi:MAG: transcriptional repressor LexA [Planctomycetota bacterium]|jgi:repressor LexA